MALSGLANPNNYLLGRGIVYIASVDANGFPKEFMDVGNASEFKISADKETIEHTSSRSGVAQVDLEVLKSVALTLGFTLDEIHVDNLRRFLLGSTATRSQAGGAVAGNNNVILSGKGRWYDLYDIAAPGSYPPPAGTNRAYFVTGVTVKDATGVTTYTLSTDYLIDADWGRLFIPIGSTIGATDTLDVAFTKTAKTVDEVRALTVPSETVALKFIGENASTGVKFQVQFHAVKLKPEGDLSLIGDNFTTLGFSGKAQKAEGVDANSPTMTITYLS